jgi:nitrogen fixation NifU-like protein
MTDDDFVNFLENLQKKIENEEEETFSKIVIREYRNPSNFGVLKDFNAFGQIKGPCGDTMKITLEIKNGRILKVCFWTDGCGPTIACGSMLTKIIKGKTLIDANNISSSQLLEALDGLPIEHHHCTVLATNTLHKAIKNFDNINFLAKKKDEI